MEDEERVEIGKVLNLLGNMLLEVGLIAAWVYLTWALDHYVVKRYPLDGPEKWLLQSAMWMISACTFYRLAKFLFVRHKKRTKHPWWV